MDTMEALRVLLRWVHTLAAVSWVGGSLFYLLVLRPVLGRYRTASWSQGLTAAFGAEFRELVRLCIAVLLVTGAVLTFDRLSQSQPLVYVLTLAVKVGAALVMFALAGEVGRRRMRIPAKGSVAGLTTEEQRTPTVAIGLVSGLLSRSLLILYLGLGVLFLAEVLRAIGK